MEPRDSIQRRIVQRRGRRAQSAPRPPLNKAEWALLVLVVFLAAVIVVALAYGTVANAQG